MDSRLAPEIEDLHANDCWTLVRSTAVGRLAVVLAEQPEIFPVNHLVDHGDILFRTAAGTKLSAAQGRRVAFEVDGVDVETGLAWSVVAKGRAHAVRQLHEVLDTFGLSLDAWQAGDKPVFVRIEVDEITGRRFMPTWRRPAERVTT